MIELHKNTEHRLAINVSPKAYRVAGDFERRSIGRQSRSAPRPGSSRRVNWEMLVLLGFVVLSFAAFALAIHIILAKCRVGGPF